jgi:pimeloyl-ACP methyl ester carboxylesterase
VISGHSQGSVLAAAAVWQLPARTRRRVALLSYGCPVERLYGRWFPACFGPAPLQGLHEEVHCWRNLWRATDPIGGPVLAGGDIDRGPLLDPLAYGRTAEHPLPAPVLGHSDYQADPEFARERALLLAELASAVPNQRADQGSSGRSSG